MDDDLIQVCPEHTMFLHTEQGTTKHNGEGVSVIALLPIGFGILYRGRYATVNLQNFTGQAIALIDAELDGDKSDGKSE